MTDKEPNQNKIMLLITTSGILIVVLTVWAQLWTQTAQLYYNNGVNSWTSVGYGLCYIYWSIFALLVSIIIMLITKSPHAVAKAFFSFSLVLTFVEVVVFSLYPVIRKISTEKDFWAPLTTTNHSFTFDIVFMVVVPAIMLLVSIIVFTKIFKK